MTEMIERVAEAMVAAFKEWNASGAVPTDIERENVFRLMSRAALTEIQEPTYAMVETGYVTLMDAPDETMVVAEKAWRVMARYALTEANGS